MAENNATILDAIRLNGGNDYQQRVPSATQAGVTAVQRALMDPMGRDLWNQFVSGLVNRIGMMIVHGRRYENPLAPFKRGMLGYGSTIQEVATDLIKAKGYEISDETLFKVNAPNSKCAFHTVNREDRYDITINDQLLRKAFTDEYGLNSYISTIMEVPFSSDNYDEYKIMVQLFAEYEDASGFFKVQVADLVNEDATEAQAKAFIKKVRNYTAKMRFLSSQYNAAGLPVFANADELVLFCTPEVSSTIDVNVLAAAFNVSFAEVQSRVVIIDEFPIPGCQAILASRDWFVCADYIYENTSFWNPQTLNTNYYLHHHGVYSVSPFMPAIMFTTDISTNIPEVTVALTGISMKALENEVEVTDVVTDGRLYDIKVAVTGSVTPDDYDVSVLPNSATFSLTAKTALGAPIQLNSRTYIDRNAVLHLQKTFPADSILKIEAKSTYFNPSGVTTPMETSLELTVNKTVV